MVAWRAALAAGWSDTPGAEPTPAFLAQGGGWEDTRRPAAMSADISAARTVSSRAATLLPEATACTPDQGSAACTGERLCSFLPCTSCCSALCQHACAGDTLGRLAIPGVAGVRSGGGQARRGAGLKHLTAIFAKLGVSARRDLVVYAYRYGLGVVLPPGGLPVRPEIVIQGLLGCPGAVRSQDSIWQAGLFEGEAAGIGITLSEDFRE